MRSVLSFLLPLCSLAAAQLSADNLETHVDSAELGATLNPVQEAYWTGYPHHRRTPFALSPDGTKAFLAYVDDTGSNVHVQPIDPATFKSTGTPVTVAGAKEAGGLVAHDDGFALLSTETMPSGTANAPPESTPVAVLYRYTDGKQTWKTWLGGPGIDSGDNLASPELNGDLVFSTKAGYYAAYFVVTSYSGSAAGHFGDAIRYVTPAGKLETIQGASSSWGCSHNTGIAFEAADAPPFASLCAEDQGAIWLNTKTQGMSNDGVKVSNEHVINGGSNEPMGGTAGSYSSLARFEGANSYIFAWVSRGAVDLTQNEWMGAGYTTSVNRTSNRNVAMAFFADKNTLNGKQATSEVGSADGDSQINWVTEGTADRSNAHAATFNAGQALVTWEEIANPICDFDAMGCRGEFTGTYYQLVKSTGEKVGEPVKSLNTFVAGDMVTMSDGRICWPYANTEWKLDSAVMGQAGSTTKKMSFACMNLSGSGSGSNTGNTGNTGGDDSGSSVAPSASSSAAPGTVTSKAESDVAQSTENSNTVVVTSEAPISSSAAAAAPSSAAPSSAAGNDAPSSKLPEAPVSSKPSATKGVCALKTVYETVTVTGAPSGA